MKQLEVHFKSGSSLTVDAVDVGATRTADALTKLNWTTPKGAKRKLFGLYSLDEVVALVVIS